MTVSLSKKDCWMVVKKGIIFEDYYFLTDAFYVLAYRTVTRENIGGGICLVGTEQCRHLNWIISYGHNIVKTFRVVLH